LTLQVKAMRRATGAAPSGLASWPGQRADENTAVATAKAGILAPSSG